MRGVSILAKQAHYPKKTVPLRNIAMHRLSLINLPNQMLKESVDILERSSVAESQLHVCQFYETKKEHKELWDGYFLSSLNYVRTIEMTFDDYKTMTKLLKHNKNTPFLL